MVLEVQEVLVLQETLEVLVALEAPEEQDPLVELEALEVFISNIFRITYEKSKHYSSDTIF